MTTQSTEPLVTLALQCAQVPSSAAGRAARRDHAAVDRGTCGGPARERPTFRVPLVLALIGHGLIGIVHGLGAIHQVKMHLNALPLCVALGGLQREPANIETLQQCMPVLRLGLRNALRHGVEHAVIQIATDRGGIIFLHAALDQEKGHFGTLQKGFHFESRIERANRVDGRRQRPPHCCGARSQIADGDARETRGADDGTQGSHRCLGLRSAAH
jgi:hypothetical protein